MISVVFLVRNCSISLRRFLLLADSLSENRVNSIFIDLFNFSDDIHKAVDELNIARPPKMVSYLTLVKETKNTRKTSDLSYSEVGDETLYENQTLYKDKVIKKIISSGIGRFRFSVDVANDFFDQMSVTGLIYDSEVPLQIRAFLFSANKRNVKTISIQHAEGWFDQYRNFPLLADYYVAYGKYNKKVLKAMGVDSTRIILSGSLDPENNGENIIKYKNLPEKIFLSKSQTGSKNKGVLVALRPSCFLEYRTQNEELIRQVMDVARSADDIQVFVKLHPRDCDELDAWEKLYKSKQIKFISGTSPIKELLRKVDVFVTCRSASIIDAVCMGKKILLVDYVEDGEWPPWDKYQVYLKLKPSNVRTALLRTLNGEIDYHAMNKKREEFIEDFRLVDANRGIKYLSNNLLKLLN